MKFRTHKQIDNHYRNKGIDVDTLNEEFNEKGIELAGEIRKANLFLRKKMGLLRYFIWRHDIFASIASPFGEIREIEKARKYGFKTRWSRY